MLARLQFMIALTGMGNKPDPRTLALEQLADVTPGISIMTEALNHATIAPWADRSGVYAPRAITCNAKITLPEGVYAPALMYETLPNGFSIAARNEPATPMPERVFTVTVNDKGGYDFRTHGPDHGVVRKETLKDADDVVTYFGEWMRRNFTGGVVRQAETWLPTVMEDRKTAASIATARQAIGPIAGTLTA